MGEPSQSAEIRTLVNSLNDLLENLSLPIQVESPLDLTPALLLGILECILRARLPISQSIRENRDLNSKIQAMKIFLGVLESDVIQEPVGLSDVDPRKLAVGEWDEVVFVGELLCWLGKKNGIIPLDCYVNQDEEDDGNPEDEDEEDRDGEEDRDEEEDENRSTHMYDGAEEQEHSEDNLFLVRETHSTQLSGSKSRSQSSPTGELRPFIPTPIPRSSATIVPMDALNLGHIHLHYQTLIYSLLLCANKVIIGQVAPVHLCNADNLPHLPLSHRIPPWTKRKTLSMGLSFPRSTL